MDPSPRVDRDLEVGGFFIGEIDFDKVDENWGMDIIIATTAKTDDEAKALLKHFNMPFNS